MKETAATKTSRVPIRELRRAIDDILARRSGRKLRVVKMHRRASAYASSSELDNLHIRLSSGRDLYLVFKNLSPAARITDAWKVRPSFINSADREIKTYRSILSRNRKLGTPEYFGSESDAGSQRYWLFIERVRGPLLWQMGRLEAWEEAARWLACLHATTSTDGRAFLLPYDADYYWTWMKRAVEFQCGTGATARQKTAWQELAASYGKVVKHLSTLPRTVIHGEFYPSNVLVRQGRSSNRICPVDWEMASAAPGVMDLAALTSGKWTKDQRMSMIGAYRDSLLSWSGRAPSLAELTESTAYGQLHLAVQLLGWCRDWQAPRAHAQDWMGTALRRARETGVIG